MSLKSLAPRMRQIPARKSAILSVLDIGASKIVCLIARLTPMEPSEALRGRTHRCKVLGIGHQRSNGVKGGAVVNGVRFFTSPTCHHTPDIYPGMAENEAALLLTDNLSTAWTAAAS